MFAQLGYYICQPFAWLTRIFYDITGSYGLALILFTLVVKLVLLPFQLKSKKSMLRMNRMQGKIKDIQTRYANNRERQQQEMADLYAREGVNPMSGCLWSFIPFPILIALYAIIRQPLRYFMSLSADAISQITSLATSLGYEAASNAQNSAYEQIYLAKFIHENWASFDGKFEHLLDMDYNFLGLNLASRPSDVFSQFPGGGWAVWGLLLLPVIATAAQFAMTFITMKSSGTQANGSSKTVMYMMPLMTLWMGYVLPTALCVYWTANTVFSILQEVFLNKRFNAILDREETEKEKEKREKRAAKMMAARENYNQQMQASNQQKKQGKKGGNQPKKKNDGRSGTNENGRVGQRPYARGRAYDEHHYE